jgi:AcrR family transcriptional regulator
MGRPREHDDATRLALLREAERLIEVGGPDAVSVRAVAEGVGTTTRAVYSVFGSKDGLLRALATRLFELLAEAIDAIPETDDPIVDIVEASLQGFRRTALAHPSLYHLVFTRVIPTLELGLDHQATALSTFARLERLVGRLSSSQPGAGPSANRGARSIHALTEGLATMELRGDLGEAAAAEAIWREALGALVRGLARR